MKISFDELMSMDSESQDKLFEREDIRIDTMGLSNDEIMKRYNFVPMDDFLKELQHKLLETGTWRQNLIVRKHNLYL